MVEVLHLQSSPDHSNQFHSMQNIYILYKTECTHGLWKKNHVINEPESEICSSCWGLAHPCHPLIKLRVESYMINNKVISYQQLITFRSGSGSTFVNH